LRIFFVNRFQGKIDTWVKNNRYILLENGEHRKNHVPFWSFVGNRAEELLNRPPAYGVDFAITEVVHCKSRKEEGVKKATSVECSNLYLDKILNLSNAKVIIIIGSVARNQIGKALALADGVHYHIKNINSIKRSIVCLPHPSSFGGEKHIFERVSEEEMKHLQSLLYE